MRNIWELFGVKENPFSTSPLLVVGGTIPIDSFVGRKEHIKRLYKILSSRGGSRTFVFGDIGVGKTSFVNVVRNAAFSNKYFTPFKEITVQENWSPDEFILNTIAAIYGTLKLLKDKPVREEIFKKLELLFSVGRNINFGISVGGFGGNYGQEISPPELLPTTNLYALFEEIIEEIKKNTSRDVIIHYNNLELLHEKKLRTIFQNLRDFFQTPGIHFIFVGNLTVHSILQSIPRFSSNLTDTPFHIETLTLEEVKEILRKRFEALRISKEYNIIYPYTSECLQILYELMDGNIRNTLNSLSTAVLEITPERPVILDRNNLSRTLKGVLEKRYLHALTPRTREVLNEIVKHTEITNKTLSDRLNIPRSNISTYIRELENTGCVYLRRKNGKDKYWSPEPKIKWLLLKESAQTTLNFPMQE